MSDTGFVIAAAGSTIEVLGGADWSNPERITADDGSNATVALELLVASDTLAATFSGLSGLIPDGATIDGIEMQVQAHQDPFEEEIVSSANLSKDGNNVAGDTKAFTAFATSPADYTVGGAADLWGTTWTRAEVIAATFSAFFDALGEGDARTVSVDAVWVKIYFTAAAAAGGARSFGVIIG